MTDAQEALVSAIFGFIFAAIFVLGLVLIKTREELIKLKQRVRDLITLLDENGDP